MKKIVWLLILVPLAHLKGQDVMPVCVENIRDSSGRIIVALFDSESDYLLTPKISTSVATEAASLIVFEGVANGTYALSVIHDRNSDGQLNKNLIGVPVEGFGFSNNAMGRFGPPSFSKAKIKWEGEGCVRIQVKYLVD